MPVPNTLCDREMQKFQADKDGDTAVNVIVNQDAADPIPVVFTSSASTPTITNLSVPLANTEVSHALTASVKEIYLRVRGIANLQYAFTATESGTKFITVPKGAHHIIEGINITSGTLYVQCDKASQTVEIRERA